MDAILLKQEPPYSHKQDGFKHKQNKHSEGLNLRIWILQS
nr:MAG TPA: hypothetical protein [Caudoviricetes sp.]DAX55200.1 MAG TPA: hypothetical protein [Bacteriophage sp.]